MPGQKNSFHILYFYAQKDKEFRDELAKHLTLMRQEGSVEEWDIHDIVPGQEIKQETHNLLSQANIILFLISADFMSEHSSSQEVKLAIERYTKFHNCMLIPIILRATDWQRSALGHFAALPRNGTPVDNYVRRDEAFFEIAAGLRKAIEEFRKQRKQYVGYWSRPDQVPVRPASVWHTPPPPALAQSTLPGKAAPRSSSPWKKRSIAVIALTTILLVGIVFLFYYVKLSSSPRSISAPPSTIAVAPRAGTTLTDPAMPADWQDAMSSPLPQSGWTQGQICSFTNGGYQVHSTGANYCLETATQFTDFQYEIQVTLQEGTHAGIVFRADGNSHLYYFFLSTSGAYGLELVNAPTPARVIKQGSVSGVKSTNELAVVAKGNVFALYINHQLIAQVQDSSFTSGYVGVAVDSYANDPNQSAVTTALFHNARVWKLHK